MRKSTNDWIRTRCGLLALGLLLITGSGFCPYALTDSELAAGYYPADMPAPVFFCGEAVPLHEGAVARRLVLALSQRGNRLAMFARIRQRARRFFPVVEPYLIRHRVPVDFKYLPLVESALNNMALSSKGAAGYWQLMPETARELGLTVNEQVDERFDLRKSTDAACRYLHILHRRFGSWTLAAAAYNLGMGRLLTSIRRQQMRNYYYLRLNAETGKYLYRILAFKELFAPRGYDIRLTPRPDRPRVAKTKADLPLDLLLPTETGDTTASLTDANDTGALLAEADMDELIREADSPTIPADSTANESVAGEPAELTLPNASAVVLGGIRARLAQVGKPERGQRWVFHLLQTDTTQAGQDTGEVLYAIVEDVDYQTNKVYLRADRVYSPADRRSYPLALGAIDTTSGRLGVTLPGLKPLPVGQVLTWKVL